MIFESNHGEDLIRVGVHVSIAGGLAKAVERARELKCSAMQIFSRNPRGWAVSPLSPARAMDFCSLLAKGDLEPIIVHTPYLLNLASPDDLIYNRSLEALSQEMQRAHLLGADYVVTHLGSSKQKAVKFGLKRVIQALKTVLSKKTPVPLLLENSCGGGGEVGSNFEELQIIIQEVPVGSQLGVCFDSCHAFAAGYDLRNKEKTNQLVREIERTVGLNRLALLHINDAAGELGSHFDRHDHIGQGKIGLAGFKNLLAHPSLRGIPLILETPQKNRNDDLRNLKKIRQILKEIYEEAGSLSSN